MRFLSLLSKYSVHKEIGDSQGSVYFPVYYMTMSYLPGSIRSTRISDNWVDAGHLIKVLIIELPFKYIFSEPKFVNKIQWG